MQDFSSYLQVHSSPFRCPFRSVPVSIPVSIPVLSGVNSGHSRIHSGPFQCPFGSVPVSIPVHSCPFHCPFQSIPLNSTVHSGPFQCPFRFVPVHSGPFLYFHAPFRKRKTNAGYQHFLLFPQCFQKDFELARAKSTPIELADDFSLVSTFLSVCKSLSV